MMCNSGIPMLITVISFAAIILGSYKFDQLSWNLNTLCTVQSPGLCIRQCDGGECYYIQAYPNVSTPSGTCLWFRTYPYTYEQECVRNLNRVNSTDICSYEPAVSPNQPVCWPYKTHPPHYGVYVASIVLGCVGVVIGVWWWCVYCCQPPQNKEGYGRIQ